jgi:hypothetical protein
LHFGDFHRSTLPLDVDDARARASTDPDKYVEVGDARAREVETFLDWFGAAYAASHQGARCAIPRAPDGGRVDELLRHGRTIARLQEMAAAMWRVTTDGVVGSERWYIAEKAPARNIWLLHRKADFLDLEVSRAQAAVRTDVTIWTRVLERIEPRIDRHSFYKWFHATTLLQVDGGVIDVMADSWLQVEWINKHYRAIVDDAVAEVQPGARVEFVVVDAQRRESG